MNADREQDLPGCAVVAVMSVAAGALASAVVYLIWMLVRSLINGRG